MKRTAKEIGAEACRQADQAMTTLGYGTFCFADKITEDQYWAEWSEAYEDSLTELEAENETIHTEET